MADGTHSTETELGQADKGNDTKAAILKAAKSTFAQHGYAGARIEEIVKLSGANVRMIYHYFGNKQGLYEEVILGEVERSTAFVEASMGLPIYDAIYSMFEQYYDRARKDPEYVRIVLWEHLTALRTAREVAGERPIFIDRLTQLIDQGKEEGLFRTGLDTKVAATFMVMGLVQCLVAHESGAQQGRFGDCSKAKLEILDTMMGVLRAEPALVGNSTNGKSR